MRSRTLKINMVSVKKICILCLGIVLLAVFSYIYSYQLSVSYASTLEQVEDKIANIKSEISEVEFQIVENKRSINKSVAVEQGFVKIEEIVFIKKTPKTALNAKTN